MNSEIIPSKPLLFFVLLALNGGLFPLLFERTSLIFLSPPLEVSMLTKNHPHLAHSANIN